MRTLGFCVAGVAATLLMVDYGAAGNGGRLLATALRTSPPEQAVVRDRKGDQPPVATTAQTPPGKPVAREAPQSKPVSRPQPTSDRPALLRGANLLSAH